MTSNKSAPSARRRRAVFALVAVVATIGSTMAVLEVGLRGYDWLRAVQARRALPPLDERCLVPSRDPKLMFELNPGWRDETFSVNSLGMPDREVTIVKPTGGVRIGFIGDSITCNFHLTPREETYVRVLERLLNRDTSGTGSFECLNFGVNGYGILQLLRMAETRVRDLNPDLIVVQVGLNDPYPSGFEHSKFGPQPRSRLWAFLYRRVRNDRFWAYSYVDRLYDDEGRARVREGVQGLGAIARDGVPVLLVLFPYLYRPAYEDWGFSSYHEMWRGEAESAGLLFLDLYGVFETEGLIDDHWPKDPVHPDSRGHRLAAEAILEKLDGWSSIAERERLAANPRSPPAD